MKSFKMGNPEDFTNFINAVIDERSFDKISGYIDQAKKDKKATVIAGGNYDKSTGYFIEPTVIETSDPNYRTLCEEIFGPVLTIFVYNDENYEKVLILADESSPYALTGAIFSNDRYATLKANKLLKHSAGNFYINDKPTGAVVGQQPFGGGRASGTNDKAGSILNLYRWVSPRTIKENFNPPSDYRYPFLWSANNSFCQVKGDILLRLLIRRIYFLIYFCPVIEKLRGIFFKPFNFVLVSSSLIYPHSKCLLLTSIVHNNLKTSFLFLISLNYCIFSLLEFFY